MPKGDVTLKFDGETAKLVQEILKLKSAMDATAKSTEKLGEAADHAGSKLEHVFETIGEGAQDVLKDVVGIGSAVAGIVAGVEVAKTAWETNMQRMETRAEGLLIKIRDVNTALGNSGQAEATPEVFEKLNDLTYVGGKLVNPREATTLFNGISSGVGGLVSPEDKFSATVAALMARAGDMDMTGAQNLGLNFANLSRERRPGGAFEGFSDEKLQDLARDLTVDRNAPLGERELRYLFRSKDKGQAVQLLRAAGRSSENGRTLTQILTASMEHISPHEKDPNKRRLMAIPEDERMSAILRDPSLVDGMEKLGVENLRRGAAQVSRLPSLSAVAKSRSGATDPVSQAIHTKETVDAFVEQGRKGKEEADHERLQIWELREAIFKKKHPYWSLIPLATTVGRYNSTEEEYGYWRQKEDESFKAGNGPGQYDMSSKESLEVLRRVLAELIAMNSKADQHHEANQSGAHANQHPGLNSGKPGQD